MSQSLDPGARRAILDAVDALREDSVEMLKRLVRCPSTLGNEQSALNEMARIYEGPCRAPGADGAGGACRPSRLLAAADPL